MAKSAKPLVFFEVFLEESDQPPPNGSPPLLGLELICGGGGLAGLALGGAGLGGGCLAFFGGNAGVGLSDLASLAPLNGSAPKESDCKLMQNVFMNQS